MSYILHTHPYSQHGRRVVAVLEAAGVDYETVIVDLGAGAHAMPDFAAINPNRQVPSLSDGEIRIHESNAAMRWLCRRHDLTDWYPQDPARLAQVEQWLDWSQTRLARPVVDIVLNSLFMGDQGDAAAIKRGHAALAEVAPILETALAGRRWIVDGDHPTIADLALGVNISHLALAGAAPNTPNISAWHDRLSAAPAYAATLPEPIAEHV